MEPLASPIISSKKATPLSRPASAQDHSDVSPLPSEPEDLPLICSPTQDQDSGKPAAEVFSPAAQPPIAQLGPESSAPQSGAEPQDQFLVSHRHPASQSLIPQNQQQSGPAVSQPPPQAQPSPSQPMSSSHSSAPSVSVPQQQPAPAPAVLFKGGDESAVPQHNSEFSSSQPKLRHRAFLLIFTLSSSEPTAALVVESEPFTVDPPSPSAQEVPAQGAPVDAAPVQTITKVNHQPPARTFFMFLELIIC